MITKKNGTDLFKRVEEFHKAFDLPIATSLQPAPIARQVLHFDLLLEEVSEFRDSYHSNDIVGIADALGDTMFVLISAVIENGLQDVFSDILEEICDSNMSKLDDDGKPIYRADGKVMKGKRYFKPKIKDIIDSYLTKSANSNDNKKEI